MLDPAQLTPDELKAIECAVEDAVEAAEAHLEWLDTPEGQREDNRDRQRVSTEARIAVLRKILGS